MGQRPGWADAPVFPGLNAITLFSGTLWAEVIEPTWENLAIAAAAGLGLIGRVRPTNRWLPSG